LLFIKNGQGKIRELKGGVGFILKTERGNQVKRAGQKGVGNGGTGVCTSYKPYGDEGRSSRKLD